LRVVAREGGAARQLEAERRLPCARMQAGLTPRGGRAGARHGQGFHNLLADLYRKMGIKFSSTGSDMSDDNPYRCGLREKFREMMAATSAAAVRARRRVMPAAPSSA
jgi:hypothetical protein